MLTKLEKTATDYQAIIFDMDGVLFDTEAFYYQRRKNFFESKGIDISSIDASIFVGGRASQYWDLILQHSPLSYDRGFLEKEYRHYKDQYPTPYKKCIFPDTNRTLSHLKQAGFQLVVASNSDLVDIKRALEESQLRDYFDNIYSATDCLEAKPHPAVYEKAWEQLGIPKAQTLIIEDSEKGIEAAVAAGIEVWAIRDHSSKMDQRKANRVIDHLSELIHLLQKNRVQ